MEILHQQGILWIEHFQAQFVDWNDVMLFVTCLGDPRLAFYLYFPLAYYCQAASGIKVLWTAAVGEWLNSILKWILFGERPYWWIHTSGLYNPVPALQQYSLTCETGPGSPSGHVMVTSAVWYVLLSEFLNKALSSSDSKKGISVALWFVYVVFMSIIGFSRCYILAHFPHQIIGGFITGIMLGHFWQHFDIEQKSLKFYSVFSISMIVIGSAVYVSLQMMGFNPMWTISLAYKWCINKQWVHLDTTPFMCFVRDVASILGTGTAAVFINANNEKRSTNLIYKSCMVLMAYVVCRVMEHVTVTALPPYGFYTIGFVKAFALPWLIMLVIPSISCTIYNLFNK